MLKKGEFNMATQKLLPLAAMEKIMKKAGSNNFVKSFQ